MHALADGIAANTNLRSLAMAQCGLGPEGCQDLAVDLKYNHILKKMDLNLNKFYCEGVLVMARALEVNLNLWEEERDWSRRRT